MSDTPSHVSTDQGDPLQSRGGWLLTRAIHHLLAWLHIFFVAPVALLIDGDNSSPDPALIAQVLVEAGKFGGVTTRRVYGNWSLPNMQRWRETAQRYGLDQRHHEQTAIGKNATDIALTVEAMDLFHRDHITHFCLMASDSDYTPLVLRLRQAGCIVIGIGEAKAPPSLVKACTFFIPTEHLTLSATNVAGTTRQPKIATTPLQPSTAEPATEAAPAFPDARLTTLLVTAYKQASAKIQKEWVPIPQLGALVKQLDPEFKALNYGYKDLPTLVSNCPELFDTRKQTTGKTNHVEVRRRA